MRNSPPETGFPQKSALLARELQFPREGTKRHETLSFKAKCSIERGKWRVLAPWPPKGLQTGGQNQQSITRVYSRV